ncbi:MAG: DUF2202 domain-containing protein [Desulfurivibrio sp.]|nr:MAG: DUF2202 domain-containing protein [Desulfurivibrio sp.]
MKKIVTTLAFGAMALASPLCSVAGTLDLGEETHLIFMREEEKLARDVYMTLGELYPDDPTFTNIGDDSEQTHTDTVRDMLAVYGIADPNPTANDLPDSIGVFTGEDYGWYFTEKFNLLVSWGSQSQLDAWYVGAFIEELDMIDIIGCPKVIVETDNGIDAGECGMEYTDEAQLKTMYGHLVAGSENHLRAYVQNIENVIGAGNYVAQVLTQEQVDAILGR